MNDLIQGALEKARQKLAVQEAAKRQELALYFDLYTREYAPDGMLTEEYCYFDSEDEPKRYFRKVALSLSDEEMAQLMQMRAQLEASAPKAQAVQHDAAKRRKPILGQALYVAGCLGLVLTVGLTIADWFINSISALFVTSGLSMFLTFVCTSLMFMGVGKGLIILTDIDNRTRSQDE